VIDSCHTVLKGEAQRFDWTGKIAKDAGRMLYAIGRANDELDGIHAVVFREAGHKHQFLVSHFRPFHDALPDRTDSATATCLILGSAQTVRLV
jgi:hypothetical protein